MIYAFAFATLVALLMPAHSDLVMYLLIAQGVLAGLKASRMISRWAFLRRLQAVAGRLKGGTPPSLMAAIQIAVTARSLCYGLLNKRTKGGSFSLPAGRTAVNIMMATLLEQIGVKYEHQGESDTLSFKLTDKELEALVAAGARQRIKLRPVEAQEASKA